MTDTLVRLGPGECPDVETGARFFAALAFPGGKEAMNRNDAAPAWCGAYLQEANRVDGSTDPFRDDRLNELVKLQPKWCRQQLRTTGRRLRDRANAARAVRPWVRDWIDQPHDPVPGVRKFTQRQIALYLCAQDTERAAMFQRRVWVPSRPVLHVAIAQDLLLCSLATDRTETDVASVGVVRAIVERADRVRRLISEDGRFGITSDQMIRFEWVC
jgi:hypothetical protein